MLKNTLSKQLRNIGDRKIVILRTLKKIKNGDENKNICDIIILD